MAVFENRSGAYFLYVSSGSAENRHLQAALAIFGSGSYEPSGDGAPYGAFSAQIRQAPSPESRMLR